MKPEKKRFTPFQIAATLMMPLLLASIAVQYNDPDGFVWMLIYGYSAFLTVPAIVGLYSPWAIPGMLGYFGGFLYLMPYFEAPYLKSELSREGGGVFIAGAWMACIAVAWYRTRQPAPAAAPIPAGTLQMASPGGGGGCGSGSCGCGK